MMDKRLLSIVPESKKYIAGNVVLQWLALCGNIVMMAAIAQLLSALYGKTATGATLLWTLLIAACVMVLRYICTVGSAKCGYFSAKQVKKTLRTLIFEKLLRLGPAYRDSVNTSEVVQVSVEGVDQLETYFGAYLPQFFYAMLAPLTLFIVLSFVSFISALVLMICVPLIPVSIALVQTWAKKLLSKYWGQYTALGDTFLENLQGLTTLKIYQTDGEKHKEMNAQAERFRRITMKVLTMQLNSVTIMDLIAYGGAALGAILAVSQFAKGKVTLAGALLIILLAADYFIPMRQLGSFFHIAMNGMAASDKIFHLLALPEPDKKTAQIGDNCTIESRNLGFSYDGETSALQNVDLTIPAGSFTAIVGESGCGKSTLAAVLTGQNKSYTGTLTLGGTDLCSIAENSLMQNITYVSHQSYIFKGTVRDQLLLGKPNASDAELWYALKQVALDGFVKQSGGLEMFLTEKGGNLSGGQCQRLALARALLKDSRIYIFDEATSNIDMESEAQIMKVISALAKAKTVILISHRLQNVVGADKIYVLQKGSVVQSGTHSALLQQSGVYADIWQTQKALEDYGKGGVAQ